jgi:hypothetical protein
MRVRPPPPPESTSPRTPLIQANTPPQPSTFNFIQFHAPHHPNLFKQVDAVGDGVSGPTTESTFFANNSTSVSLLGNVLATLILY